MKHKPTKTIMCRYYALGQCNRGIECPFSHDNSHKPSEICKFYQTGNCVYKDKCLNKHIYLPKYQEIKDEKRTLAKLNPLPTNKNVIEKIKNVKINDQSMVKIEQPNNNAAIVGNSDLLENNAILSEEMQFDLFSKIMNLNISDNDREDVIRGMTSRSDELECAICLENVLGHFNAIERNFGLLENCTHVFCLHCIRNWRSKKNNSLEYALSCPICRAKSNFVTPCRYFPDSQEEKTRVILEYRHELKKLHCHYFNRGRSKCPFSTSCFYRHEFLDGTLATDRQLVLNSDGIYQVYSQYDEEGDPFSDLIKAFNDEE